MSVEYKAIQKLKESMFLETESEMCLKCEVKHLPLTTENTLGDCVCCKHLVLLTQINRKMLQTISLKAD